MTVGECFLQCKGNAGLGDIELVGQALLCDSFMRTVI